MTVHRLGCCISGHGFGHAARTLAVMEALADRLDLHCTVATTVPEWFFRGSYHGSLSYHHLQTDVGLVQRSPLEEDVPATIRALAGFYPLRSSHLDRLALIFADCDLVLCDIAPAGIMAARQTGVPSVLLENFTWDWIYEGYRRCTHLRPYAQLIRDLFSQADYHIQCLPVCAPAENDMLVGPVARKVRSGREGVRQRLSLAKIRKLCWSAWVELVSEDWISSGRKTARLSFSSVDERFLPILGSPPAPACRWTTAPSRPGCLLRCRNRQSRLLHPRRSVSGGSPFRLPQASRFP